MVHFDMSLSFYRLVILVTSIILISERYVPFFAPLPLSAVLFYTDAQELRPRMPLSEITPGFQTWDAQPQRRAPYGTGETTCPDGSGLCPSRFPCSFTVVNGQDIPVCKNACAASAVICGPARICGQSEGFCGSDGFCSTQVYSYYTSNHYYASTPTYYSHIPSVTADGYTTPYPTATSGAYDDSSDDLDDDGYAEISSVIASFSRALSTNPAAITNLAAINSELSAAGITGAIPTAAGRIG